MTNALIPSPDENISNEALHSIMGILSIHSVAYGLKEANKNTAIAH